MPAVKRRVFFSSRCRPGRESNVENGQLLSVSDRSQNATLPHPDTGRQADDEPAADRADQHTAENGAVLEQQLTPLGSQPTAPPHDDVQTDEDANQSSPVTSQPASGCHALDVGDAGPPTLHQMSTVQLPERVAEDTTTQGGQSVLSMLFVLSTTDCQHEFA